MLNTEYEDGSNVPVGFLNTENATVLSASTASVSFGGNITVRVTPLNGSAWIAIGESPTAQANANGNHYIEQAQDFSILKTHKIIATDPIQVTPFK